MHLTVNGEQRAVDGPASVAELVATVTGRTRGIAVAVNGSVVPKSTWDRRALVDGDRVEILTAVQGG